MSTWQFKTMYSYIFPRLSESVLLSIHAHLLPQYCFLVYYLIIYIVFYVIFTPWNFYRGFCAFLKKENWNYKHATLSFQIQPFGKKVLLLQARYLASLSDLNSYILDYRDTATRVWLILYTLKQDQHIFLKCLSATMGHGSSKTEGKYNNSALKKQ
jgi:hypothetical protein